MFVRINSKNFKYYGLKRAIYYDIIILPISNINKQ